MYRIFNDSIHVFILKASSANGNYSEYGERATRKNENRSALGL